MPEFLTLHTPQEALDLFLRQIVSQPIGEITPTKDALDRVLLEEIHAPHPLPSFPRSTVDGFAVRAGDTHGASESLPAYLKLIGEVLMGQAPEASLRIGECMMIHTGGMLPIGADAVLMIEHSQYARENEVEVLKAVSVGENILKVGEDLASGELVMSPGMYLRPAEIGGLMALGITKVRVAKRPVVGIISSGDEVVPPDQAIRPGQVRDVNSYTLHALIQEAGGEPMLLGILPDHSEAFRLAAQEGLARCDIVVFTAGSSVSVRDLTASTIEALGKPGVLVHGINIRPGKPTILAICDGKPVIGLPGNPVSALVIAGLFLKPVIRRLAGVTRSSQPASLDARLTTNLPSQAGREDWIPVQVTSEGETYLAEPVFGKSNLIFTLVRADGLVRIPLAATGLAAGEMVKVWLM